MKRSSWIILAVLAAILAVALWLIFASAPSNVKTQQTNVIESNQLLAKGNAKPAIIKKQKKTAGEDEEDEFNPYEDEVLKASIQQISDIYQDNIKFPTNSQPIRYPESREYEPFEEAEVDLPFPEGDDDENPIRIAASTNTFQYFQGDTIVTRVRISGAPEDTFISVEGVISGPNGDVPIEAVFQPSNQALTEFVGSFDTNIAPANLMTPEMLVKLNVTIGSRALTTTVAFKYAIASAEVTGVQQVRPQGPELVIPLQLNVFRGGYYFIRAILEEAATGRALIQLQAEGRLALGNGVLELNAHIAALQRGGSEGPYVLRSIRVFRGADVGESFDAPAKSSQARFTIQGFPFSAYDNEEYQNDLAQERLDFLRNLGAVDEEQAQENQTLSGE